MPPLNLLIKPASSKCNLNCKYCFYHNISENRLVKDHGKMSKHVLENLIKKSFEYAEFYIYFAFQGGEPTLAGIEYFYQFHEYVEYYNIKKIQVSYSLQTNATLLDQGWVELFKKYNYLIGVSLDGMEDIHDCFRKDWDQKGSFQDVMSSIKILQQNKVDFNILTVITKKTVENIDNIYDFFQKQDFKYLQFIPCMDKIDEKIDYEYHLSSDLYAIFLKKLFLRYKKDLINKNYMSIRYFDNLVRMMLGRNPESCAMVGKCSITPTIESDGSVYPCDFYVLDQYKLGNILNISFDEVFNHQIVYDFVQDSLILHDKCKSCKYLSICRGGGCKKYRDSSHMRNYFCDAYYQFFELNYKELLDISKMIKSGYFNNN